MEYQVDVKKWISIAESFKPDYMQVLTDSDIPKDCSNKRREKAISRSKEMHRASQELAKNNDVRIVVYTRGFAFDKDIHSVFNSNIYLTTSHILHII